MNRFIIACAGENYRWNNYLGTTKHLIKINNETLLERTVRLIMEKVKDADIYIAARSENYHIDNTQLYLPDIGHDFPAIYTTTNIWNSKGRTFLLSGDVYFTENAMDIICSDKKNSYNFYGRSTESKITGSPYGEIWGLSFYSNEQVKIHTALSEILIGWMRGQNDFKHWELYKYLNNIPLYEYEYEVKENFIEINDFTEDFDFPSDYDIWIKKWTDYNKNKII